MVTSTPLENLSLLLYKPPNKNFNFGTSKTLILHARSIFFKGGHKTKIWSKKYFHENPVEVMSFDGSTQAVLPTLLAGLSTQNVWFAHFLERLSGKIGQLAQIQAFLPRI
jgi:hypothetical protein